LDKQLAQAAMLALRSSEERKSDPLERGGNLAAPRPNLDNQLVQLTLSIGRAMTLVCLMPHLDEPERSCVLAEALTAARDICHEELMAYPLCALVLCGLREAERSDVMTQALTATRAIGDERERAELLGGLIPYLAESERSIVLIEALTAAQAIEDLRVRAKALNDLVQRLAEPERSRVVAMALTAAREIGDEKRIAALHDDSGRLRLSRVREAISIGDTKSRANALGDLAESLAEPQRSRVMAEALTTAREINGEWDRAKVLSSLAPRLGEPERSRVLLDVLTAARAIGDGDEPLMAKGGLLPALHLREKLLLLLGAILASAGVLAMIRGIMLFGCIIFLTGVSLLRIVDYYSRSRFRSTLFLKQDGPDPYDARCAAREKPDVLSKLAQFLEEPERSHVMAEALRAARAFSDPKTRVEVLGQLLPYLNERDRCHVRMELTAARAIVDKRSRVNALMDLSLHLGEPERSRVLNEVLADSREIGDKDARESALSALRPQSGEVLPGEVLRDSAGLGGVEDLFGDREDLFKKISSLAPPSAEPERSRVLNEVLASARAISSGSQRSRALGSLAPHFREPDRSRVIMEALGAARAIEGEWYRAISLSHLAAYLDQAELHRVLTSVLSPGMTLLDEWFASRRCAGGTDPLKAVADGLEAAVAKSSHEHDRVQALSSLAPHLNEAQLGRALTEVLTINDAQERVCALSGLAPYLKEPDRFRALSNALVAAQEIEDGKSRAEALRTLAPRLVSLSLPCLVGLWSATLHQLSAHERSPFLADLTSLSPVIIALGGRRGAEEFASAISDVGRWWP
jgi:hypothetical protein